MELIRGLHNLRERHRDCVVTIGNFDGVHLGHRAILSQLSAIAHDIGLPTVLVTFEPTPQEFFAGENAPSRLSRFREKMLVLKDTDLDRVVVLRFNRALAGMAPHDFIEQVLVERLGARRVVVGDDFRFGHRGEGNFALLQEAGERFDFEVMKRDTFRVGGGRVSSSWVRDALANGELDVVATLLGRPYSMCGRVAYGDQRGRTIDFPTANIAIRRLVPPLRGVYAVRTHGAADAPQTGVANIGSRPTVNGVRTQLEVYLFDFEQDIYGRHLRVEFLSKLRDEKRFDSFDALKQQINRDAERAREFFELQE